MAYLDTPQLDPVRGLKQMRGLPKPTVSRSDTPQLDPVRGLRHGLWQ